MTVDYTTINSQRLGTYIAGGLGWYADVSVWEADFARMEPLQASIARANFDVWSGIETASGVFSWTKMDQIVDACEAANIDLIMTMPISSSWNLPAGTSCPASMSGIVTVGCTHFPTDNQVVASGFYGAVAARYAGRIPYYEVWNEPDYGAFWKAEFNPSAAEYITIMTTAKNAIKAADPAAQVIMGGMAFPEGPTAALQSFGITNDWYVDFFNQGGAALVDGINVHIYPAFATFSATLPLMTSQLASAGVTGKRIWVTETSTTGGYFDTTDRATEEYNKALWLVKNYTYFFSRSDTGNIIWHTLRNPGADVGVTEYDFGLMTYAGSILPAYTAHETWSDQLIGKTFSSVTTSQGVNDYLFTQGIHNTHVLWTDSGTTTYTVPESNVATLTTIYGSSNPITAGTQFTVTTQPVYLSYDTSTGGLVNPNDSGVISIGRRNLVVNI